MYNFISKILCSIILYQSKIFQVQKKIVQRCDAYLWVNGPTMGLANNWTKALEANIIPTATVSSSNSRCLCSFSFVSDNVRLATVTSKMKQVSKVFILLSVLKDFRWMEIYLHSSRYPFFFPSKNAISFSIFFYCNESIYVVLILSLYDTLKASAMERIKNKFTRNLLF